MRDNWRGNQREAERLVQAGVDNSVIDSAFSSFVLQTIAHHGEPAEVTDFLYSSELLIEFKKQNV